ALASRRSQSSIARRHADDASSAALDSLCRVLTACASPQPPLRDRAAQSTPQRHHALVLGAADAFILLELLQIQLRAFSTGADPVAIGHPAHHRTLTSRCAARIC